MKHNLSLLLLLAFFASFGQNKTPKDFGFTHLQYVYKSDPVDILIKSKKGEESIKKPILFFCQGSLPQPLIKYHQRGTYGVFPFNPDSLTDNFHLIIVSKPYVPLIADATTLGSNFSFVDSTGRFPAKYSERNLLDYYVNRNLEIIRFLQEQKWISSDQLVLAGHSEGSTIAAKIASMSSSVTHLIYSGGNPMGRIMTMIQQSRATETDTDSTRYGEQELAYWENAVENKMSIDDTYGDTPKATFDFSHPPIEYLMKLKIPVFVTYGSKDWSASFNDYLRVDVIRKQKRNFTFKCYIGTEHNYFPLAANNRPNHEVFNWDRVAGDWARWLMKVK